MSARDVRYGRRGGRWVPTGVVPGTGVADLAAYRAQREAAAVPPAPEQLALALDDDEGDGAA